jgi:hypothetical protein
MQDVIVAKVEFFNTLLKQSENHLLIDEKKFSEMIDCSELGDGLC